MLVFITIIYWIANLESILQIRNMSDQNAALAKKATQVKTPTQKELRRLQDRMRQHNKGKRTNKGAGNNTSGDISTKTSFINPPFMSSSSVKTVTCIEVSRDENILTVQAGEDQSYTRKIDVVNPNIHLDHNDMSGSSAPILAATEDSLSHPMDDESEQMHADSFGVNVSDNQSLEDSLPVIKHAGSYGEGLPYAPENWPSLGDVWTWRVGKRYTLAGFWQDRSVHPPDCLRSSMGSKMGFNSRVALERYIQNTFPDADVDAFFASFVWKIPCTDAARDNTQIVNASASPNIIKSNGNSKSALAVRPGGCKASNEMCRVNLKTSSSLNPATCYICCSEPNFCRYCCCILCSKTIDLIYDGCKFIKCEAPVDEKFICGHVAHIECGLRAHLAGKVGGNIDLDAQYYCRCCDNKTDLLLHVDKIIKICESIDNRDDTRKILNLGLSILRGSEKEKAKKLRNHIAISIEKLHHGASCDEKWKKKSEVLEPEQGSQMGRSYYDDFNLDLVPIDKDAMLNNLDAVKQDIERMHNWQRLVDELQRVNQYNQEAMLTMENDKSEWVKTLKKRDDELSSIVVYNEELENKLKMLQDELDNSSNLYNQREEFLTSQVKDAHAAQAAAEHQLVVEQKVMKTYRNDLAQKSTAQSLEISTLQHKLAKAEQERDQALIEKAAAELSHENMRAEIDSNFFELYVHSIMGRGSLSFLGPKYEITLAEVWERILEMTEDDGYTEEELMLHFLNDEARVALARGKEKLAKERAVASGTELSHELTVHDPTLTASSSDIHFAAPSLPSTQAATIASAPTEGETQALTEQTFQEEKDESDDAQQLTSSLLLPRRSQRRTSKPKLVHSIFM